MCVRSQRGNQIPEVAVVSFAARTSLHHDSSGLALSPNRPGIARSYFLLLWVASRRTCSSRVVCRHGFPKVRCRICNRQGPCLPLLVRGHRRCRPVHMDPAQWHETCMHKVDNLCARRTKHLTCAAGGRIELQHLLLRHHRKQVPTTAREERPEEAPHVAPPRCNQGLGHGRGTSS